MTGLLRQRDVRLIVGAVGVSSVGDFGGLGHGTKNVLARTLIQKQVPSRLHGRAFAAYNGLRNGAELIALAAGGVLVAAIGARTALAGAIPLLAALAGLAVYRARLPAGEAPTASAPSLPSG